MILTVLNLLCAMLCCSTSLKHFENGEILWGIVDILLATLNIVFFVLRLKNGLI